MEASSSTGWRNTEVPHGEVAAALVNWNGMQYIGRCLEALAAQTRPPGEIVLVDNGSTDGSREWVRKRYPRIKVLENPTNEGVAVGYNQAIQACTSPFILIINTDVFLEADFIAEALKGLEGRPDIGAVTGRIDEEATGRQISGGFFMRRQIRMLPGTNKEREEEVFGCTGAVVLFRRAALESVKVEGEYFDGSFFSYSEDIDLAWRAQLYGWKARSLPRARAYHVGSGSLGGRFRFVDKPAFIQRHVLKNRYLTVLKNASPGVFFYLLPSLVLSELLLWPYLLVCCTRQFPHLLGAPIDALRLLPQTWRKRRLIQQNRRVSGVYIRRFFARF